MSQEEPPRAVFQPLEPDEEICRLRLDVHPDGPLAGFVVQEGRFLGSRYLRRRSSAKQQSDLTPRQG
jgi:hypothetical protein